MIHQQGIYRHWKGDRYLLLFLARDSNNTANREDVVVYLSLTAPYTGAVNIRVPNRPGVTLISVAEMTLPNLCRSVRFFGSGPAWR